MRFVEDMRTVLWFFFVGLPLALLDMVRNRGHWYP
jgi:hypothetical protein